MVPYSPRQPMGPHEPMAAAALAATATWITQYPLQWGAAAPMRIWAPPASAAAMAEDAVSMQVVSASAADE